MPFQLSRNESKAPPWLVSSTEAKQPEQTRSTSSRFGTSTPAEAPLYVIVKPVDAAPVTVAVPGKPGTALIAVVRFALLYARPVPPMTAESAPPMRTRKGEKYVAVPPPEFARSRGRRGAPYCEGRAGTAPL